MSEILLLAEEIREISWPQAVVYVALFASSAFTMWVLSKE